MNFMSKFLEVGFLNVMRNISFPAPQRVWVGLFLTSPGESGIEGTEISYNGYTRMEVTFSPPILESSMIVMRNNHEIIFPESPINAGTARHIGIFDSPIPGSGNMYAYGNLEQDLVVTVGKSPVLLLNQMSFALSGQISNAYMIRLLNVIRGVTLTGVNSFHSLWNGDPESGGSELSDLNYERPKVIFSVPPQQGDSFISNSEFFAYNRPTLSLGNWSNSAIMDSQTSGEPIWKMQRPSPGIVPAGELIFFNPGNLVVRVN